MKAVFALVCALASASLVIAKVCPGGGQSCQPYMTCCELPSGRQGCCPHSNATCCPDKVHCCPSGYHCHWNSCQKQNEDKVIATTKLMIDYEEPNVETVEGYRFTNASTPDNTICPDQGLCPDGNTCCKLSPTEYGCCPLEHAYCCNDFKHCCQKGYKCDGTGSCVKSVMQHVAMTKKLAAPMDIVAMAEVVAQGRLEHFFFDI
ncbi:hypothetical protein C0J52_01255 [Blattella germanica]|nr:hypothetical protein C0J52_01255 [Blattella germanica]